MGYLERDLIFFINQRRNVEKNKKSHNLNLRNEFTIIWVINMRL
jgi:hypothetical protein